MGRRAWDMVTTIISAFFSLIYHLLGLKTYMGRFVSFLGIYLSLLCGQYHAGIFLLHKCHIQDTYLFVYACTYNT